jgi:hypothetical protein
MDYFILLSDKLVLFFKTGLSNLMDYFCLLSNKIVLFFKTGLSNIPYYLAASGSDGSSGLPSTSNFPGGGWPGPNDFKLKFNHILNTDTDNLADFMRLGLKYTFCGWNADGSVNLTNKFLTLKELGIPGNISPITGKTVAYESNVFSFITKNGHIQLNVDTKISQSMIDSVRALKLNVPTS